jgi:succinylglutamate desuccinylase
MIDFKTIDSWKTWINLVVFWCIHGNETCWFYAISNILKMFEIWKIKLLSWKVTFVPIANKKAFELWKRYVDVNLNRVFKKHEKPQNYEEKIADELTDFIDKNDVLLDIHSTSSKSDPFVFLDYNDNNNNFLAKSCWLKNIVIWWPEIYWETESSDSCSYVHSLWKTWVTIECWSHFDISSVKVWENSILGVLSAYNMIDFNIESLNDFNEIKVNEFITKKSEWKMLKDFNHMDIMKSWDIIAVYDDWTQIKAPYDGYILLPFKEALVWDEWFYFWEKIK